MPANQSSPCSRMSCATRYWQESGPFFIIMLKCELEWLRRPFKIWEAYTLRYLTWKVDLSLFFHPPPKWHRKIWTPKIAQTFKWETKEIYVTQKDGIFLNFPHPARGRNMHMFVGIYHMIYLLNWDTGGFPKWKTFDIVNLKKFPEEMACRKSKTHFLNHIARVTATKHNTKYYNIIQTTRTSNSGRIGGERGNPITQHRRLQGKTDEASFHTCGIVTVVGGKNTQYDWDLK